MLLLLLRGYRDRHVHLHAKAMDICHMVHVFCTCSVVHVHTHSPPVKGGDYASVAVEQRSALGAVGAITRINLMRGPSKCGRPHTLRGWGGALPHGVRGQGRARRPDARRTRRACARASTAHAAAMESRALSRARRSRAPRLHGYGRRR